MLPCAAARMAGLCNTCGYDSLKPVCTQHNHRILRESRTLGRPVHCLWLVNIV